MNNVKHLKLHLIVTFEQVCVFQTGANIKTVLNKNRLNIEPISKSPKHIHALCCDFVFVTVLNSH